MKVQRIAALSALLVLAACVRDVCAQALPAASGPGSYVAVGAGYSAYQADFGQRVLAGGVAFVDVHPTWRYGVEGEARLLNKHTSEGVKESIYLAGPIVYVRSKQMRPYVKLLAGAGKIDLPFGYAHGTYFAYAPGVGVDYLLSDRVSLRLIDVEYQSWPQFTFGNLHPYGVSAGIVFRLTGMKRYPGR